MKINCKTPLVKIFIIIFLISLTSCSSKNWRDRSRESANISPPAESLTEDIVQVFYARAVSWRGYFGVHPWISWKKINDKQYTVAEVTAWNLRRNGNSTISVTKGLPDRIWFDSMPNLLFEARGRKALNIIHQIENLMKSYPHKDMYRVWPGPNSNTFVAYMLRNIKELDIELPPNAVGKDYLGPSTFFANTPSNTGFQFSVLGILGLSAGIAEGLEVNFLGLNFGFDIWTPALKLPMIGRLGFKDKSL